MEYRAFGATDIKVSVLGIGCSRIGSFLAKKDDKEVIAMLQEAVDSGVNFFDTSDIYGQGDSERILGRALHAKRDKVIFETKAGNCFSQTARAVTRFKAPVRAILKHMSFLKKKIQKIRSAQLSQNFDPIYLATAVDNSLQRLQTDYIDVFMLHSPPSTVIERGEFFDLADQLKRSGKIRCFGVSCDSGSDALLCLKNPGVDVIQVPVNGNERVVLDQVLPLAATQRVGVVARSPFAGGVLLQYANPSEVASRKSVNNFTPAQAALLSAVSCKGVSVVIAGMTSRRHLHENLLPFTG